MGMPVITASNVTRCQAITDIIESIALEQTALSHILNAEGEKLQKIILNATTADEMLTANKSVRDLVNSIMRLQMVLQSKLDLFEECLCSSCQQTGQNGQ